MVERDYAMEAKVEERPAIRVEAPAVPKKKEGDLPVEQNELKMKASDVNLWYGEKQALFDVNLEMFDQSVTALIGPSGCGKSTFLRCLDRMNDVIDGVRITGDIRLDGEDIYAPRVDPVQLRARVGMVFQKPNPFPKSIFENVAYGPRIHGLCKSKAEFEEIVERSLTRAGLWEEVKDRLDEPCSALDPIATAKIETLMDDLKKNLCIVIVTHSMQQAARVSQRTAFFHLGKLVEVDDTTTIFTNPTDQRTQDYVTGRFG